MPPRRCWGTAGRSALPPVSLSSPGRRSGSEHAQKHRGILCAVAAVAEVAWHVGRRDRTDGLDPMVTGGRSEYVPPRAADPQRSDPLGVDHIVPSRQIRHRGLEVLGAMGGVLEPAGLALALALIGRVERERNEPLLGQAPRVQARRLFLDTAAAGADDDRRAGPSGIALGYVQMTGEVQTGTVKRDVCSHGDSLLTV